jgi:hypothetical protein
MAGARTIRLLSGKRLKLAQFVQQMQECFNCAVWHICTHSGGKHTLKVL